MRASLFALPLVLALGTMACASHATPSTDSNAQNLSNSVVPPAENQCVDKPRTVVGDQARNLIQALMFAKIKPTAHTVTSPNGAYTDVYAQSELACQDAHGFEDGIARFDCRTPSINESGAGDDDARAKVLFDAIYGLDIAGDSGLGHSFAHLSDVKCTLALSDNDPTTYTCAVTGTWASDCK